MLKVRVHYSSKIYCINARGSGLSKSTRAMQLYLRAPKSTVVVSADLFFMDRKGNYLFKQEHLGRAHQFCQTAFLAALNNPQITTILLIIRNINYRDYSFYLTHSQNYEVLEWICQGNYENGHGVPKEIVRQKYDELQKDLK